MSEGVAEVETADGSDENAKCGDQQNLHDVFFFLSFLKGFLDLSKYLPRLARGFFKFFEKSCFERRKVFRKDAKRRP